MKLSCTWGALFDYARLPFVLHAGYIILSRLFSDVYAALPTRAPQPPDLSSADEDLALNLTQLIGKHIFSVAHDRHLTSTFVRIVP